jgi:T5SS/PEP-CTERM-associated repeat protein
MKLFLSLATIVASVGVQAQDLEFNGGDTNFIDGNIDISPSDIIMGVDVDDNLLYINNLAQVIADEVVVGDGSSGNSLQIYEGATLYSDTGVIGNGIGADGNEVIIYAGSGWGNNDSLTVGASGSQNRLELQDSAQAASGSLVVGLDSEASDNEVLVSGGNLTVNGTMVVGNEGGTNRVEVLGGGWLSSVSTYVGGYADANGNEILVSGADSSWTNSGVLNIGTNGNFGNIVTVTNGGAITVGSLVINEAGVNGFELVEGGQLTVTEDFDASLGGFNFGEGAALFVEGALSGQTNGIEGARMIGISGASGSWDQTGSNITVGGSSSDNALYVLDGASVLADELRVGTGSNTLDNAVFVSGSGTQVSVGSVLVGSTNSSGNSVELTSGGKMVVTGSIATDGSNNTFSVNNGGWLTVETDFDASIAGFDFGDNGILETTGSLTGMSNSLENGRSVLLNGASADWDTGAGLFTVGDSSSGNTIYVTNAASLVSDDATLGATAAASGNQVMLIGSGVSWDVAGVLTVGDAGSNNSVEISDGAELLTTGDAVIGASGNQNSVTLTGTNSEWNAAGNVSVGSAGSDNQLMVEDTAQLSSASAFVGGTGSGNQAGVRGAGSQWTTIGNFEIDGMGNSLNISESGMIDVGSELSVKNGATLAFSEGGTAVAGSYVQDVTGIFQFDSVTNEALDSGAAILDVSGAAVLDDGATFEFVGAIGSIEVGVTNSRKLITSGTLTANLANLNGLTSNSLLQADFANLSDELYYQIFRQNLAESAGFAPGTDMYGVSEEIDQMASSGNSVANTQLGILGNMSGAQQNAQLTQLYGQGAPTYRHMEGLFEGMRQVRKGGVMPDSMWPVGAGGPHLYGDQGRAWIKGYGSWASQDGADAYSGFDQNVYGVAIGYDKAFGDLLAGLAGGYSSSDISQDDGDTSKGGTGYGILYGSWGTSAWFADGSLGLGFGSVKNTSGTAFDSTADVDDTQFAFALGGGKEMIFMDDKVFLTPAAGFRGGLYAQDSYTENSANAVARNVDAYNRWSMQSEVGIKATFQKELVKVAWMPEVHLNWLHEFNADEERVGYSLQGGTGNYSFGMQAPVADLFEAGLGLSFWTESKSGVVYEWALGYDARFGDGYSASMLDARLMAEF